MFNLLLPWLEWQDSLTDKLTSHAGQSNLEVLINRWETRNWWDKYALNIQDEQVFHREIIMRDRDLKPCWYARTIIPQSTFASDEMSFKRLEKESLQKLVFNNHKITRLSLAHYSLTPDDIEFHWLTPQLRENAEMLWARKSIFSTLSGHTFYLIEILLPRLLRYAH